MSDECACISPVVFVVDDDETALLLAEDALTGSGFRVDVFKSSLLAFEFLSSGMPDILVLDLMMPGMDGITFCSRLRKLPGGKDLPVLIMTSLEDPSSIEKSYEAGATSFAAKPINWAIESHRLRYMLRTAKTAKELRRKEQETRLAKEEWEQTFNAIRDIVTVIDPERRILRANSATMDMFGRPVEEIIGKICCQLFHGLERPCPGCPTSAALETGDPAKTEMALLDPDKSFAVSAFPVKNREGRIVRIVHVVHDLTEMKALEGALRQAQKMEAIGTLAGGVAHDFNNLLQVIMGYAELVSCKKPDPDITTILEAARRGSSLTRQLLTFSRYDSAKSQKQAVRLSRLVRDFLKMILRVLPKSVAVETDLAPDLPAIHADSGNLEQVLMNLSVNAAHAMPDGGVLFIRTAMAALGPEFCRAHPEIGPGVYTLLEMSDTGHGMNVKTLNRMFEPFFTTKEIGNGSGVGLSVVYGIVKDHGGCIDCMSAPGKGTCFRIYFPASEGAPEETEGAAVKLEPIPSGSETVLIVDDDGSIRTAVKTLLSSAGYNVLLAASGRQAIECYSDLNVPPDLVILDIGMPKMSGWECLASLRQIDPNSRILMATGYGGDELHQKAADLGAVGVILKPFNRRELIRRAREALDR